MAEKRFKNVQIDMDIESLEGNDDLASDYERMVRAGTDLNGEPLLRVDVTVSDVVEVHAHHAEEGELV